MASSFRTEPAAEQDIPSMVSLIATCFSFVPVEKTLFGDSSPDNLAEVGKRHLHAWKLHSAVSDVPCAIKCVHTDPSTGRETLVGLAYWWINTRERTVEEYSQPDYLRSASWVANVADREKAVAFCKPFLDGRNKWMGGRPHALLMYMCVSPEWRRRGISTICVQWGLDQCQRLGIPAFLEASEEGAPVYERLGFELVEPLHSYWDGVAVNYPAMIWWPAGTRAEDKRPALL